MKKIFLSVAMMAGMMTLNAQSRFEPGTFTLQPRIGGTASTLTNVPDVDIAGTTIEPSATEGNFIGVDAEYYLTSRVSFAGGISFSGAGVGYEKYKFNVQGTQMKVDKTAINTDYISVPLTVNWYVAKGFALKAGLQFGFLTSAEDLVITKYSDSDADYTVKATNDVKDDFKTFDLSIPVGLSYEFKVPIVLDLRCNVGLTKVIKGVTPNQKDYRNFQTVLTVGYKFKL